MKKKILSFVYAAFENIYPLLKRKRRLERDKIRRILVSEEGGLGDLLLILPAAAALHANFPAASLSLLASPAAKGVLPLFGVNDAIREVIDYDLAGRHKRLVGKMLLALQLRRRRFDLAYSPARGEGMREHIFLAFSSGAPHRWGFRLGKLGSLHTLTLPFRPDEPIQTQNLAILRAAGLRVEETRLPIRPPESERQALQGFLAERGLAGHHPLVAVHPGASWRARYKCWPQDRYRDLISRLIGEFDARVILLGNADETAACRAIAAEVQAPGLLNLAGQTTLAEMACCLDASHLFIGNDSGPMHLARALRVPTVAIFGSTSARQAIAQEADCTVIQKELSCSPCYRHEEVFRPSCTRPRCLEEITVLEVVGAARRLLQRSE